MPAKIPFSECYSTQLLHIRTNINKLVSALKKNLVGLFLNLHVGKIIRRHVWSCCKIEKSTSPTPDVFANTLGQTRTFPQLSLSCGGFKSQSGAEAFFLTFTNHQWYLEDDMVPVSFIDNQIDQTRLGGKS